MDLKKVKLIIWDLDDTLWAGTLSEGDVEVKTGIIEFINHTLDMGIVHSICSKNDYQQTKEKLEELGLWDLFVFASIDWTPKGSRIRAIIDNMNLRPGNVLFVDDNPQNREEAKYYCDSIMIAAPNDIDALTASGGGTVKKQIQNACGWRSTKFYKRKPPYRKHTTAMLDF